MIFTEPVVITGLLSGGYSSGATLNYVDNFTVEYAPSEDSDFVLYRVIGEDSETQVSTVHGNNSSCRYCIFHCPMINNLSYSSDKPHAHDDLFNLSSTEFHHCSNDKHVYSTGGAN